MGGAICGDAFASRARFLEYTMAFEERLAVAKAIRPGPGVLVFCGNGFAWRRSNLEDWAVRRWEIGSRVGLNRTIQLQGVARSHPSSLLASEVRRNGYVSMIS
jgi:hypothetical protein